MPHPFCVVRAQPRAVQQPSEAVDVPAPFKLSKFIDIQNVAGRLEIVGEHRPGMPCPFYVVRTLTHDVQRPLEAVDCRHARNEPD